MTERVDLCQVFRGCREAGRPSRYWWAPNGRREQFRNYQRPHIPVTVETDPTTSFGFKRYLQGYVNDDYSMVFVPDQISLFGGKFGPRTGQRSIIYINGQKTNVFFWRFGNWYQPRHWTFWLIETPQLCNEVRDRPVNGVRVGGCARNSTVVSIW